MSEAAHATCSCGTGWTFDFQQRRVFCKACEMTVEEHVARGDRMCPMCETWSKRRECKACGMKTEKADR
jgi:hypothetical protein